MAKGWTYQTLIDGKMTVTAYCHACNHHKALDLEALRDLFGPDAPAMADDVIPKLKCEKCQSKKVGVIYAPDPPKCRAWAIRRRIATQKPKAIDRLVRVMHLGLHPESRQSGASCGTNSGANGCATNRTGMIAVRLS